MVAVAWDGGVPWVVGVGVGVVPVPGVLGVAGVPGAVPLGVGVAPPGPEPDPDEDPEADPAEDPAARSGPSTDGSTARSTWAPLVPSRMRATRESGPMARCQADSRVASLREKRPTSGSSVRGTTVATLSGTYSLRAFHAMKVRVIPVGSLAPSWTTSTEIGSAATASSERSRSHGTVAVKGCVCPAATVAMDAVPTVRPEVSVRPEAQSSSALRWLTVTSPRTTRTSGPDSGPVRGAVTVPVMVTSLPGPTTAGDRVSSTMTATSLAGTTAGPCAADEAGPAAYVLGPADGAALASAPPAVIPSAPTVVAVAVRRRTR